MQKTQILRAINFNRIFPDIAIDEEYQLVIGKQSDKESVPSLASHLHEVANFMANAILKDKHILILSGCYDLAHIGHLLYVEQCVKAFTEYKKCIRENVCVILLADDDALIYHNKKEKLNTEPLPRPVEPLNTRLQTLAVFPVDLVGGTPFPKPYTKETEIIENINISFNQEAKRLFEEIEEEIKTLLPNIKTGYETSSLEAEFQKEFSPVIWHCKIFSYLIKMVNNAGIQKTKITRLVSMHDTNYLLPVLWLTRYSDIEIHLIDDINVQSTSAIIDKILPIHGKDSWEFIRKYKEEQLKLIQEAV